MSLANNYELLTADARKVLGSTSKLYIDGQWAESSSGATIDVVDPSHGAAIARLANGTAADVDRAVTAARKAFETGPWHAMRPFERAQIMLRLAELLAGDAENLAQIETLNSGKLLSNTRLLDVGYSVHTLRYMAGWADKFAGRTLELSVPYLPGTRFAGSTRLRPIGVVAGITPWNVPLSEAVWKLAPVLATGCTIVLKPAEQTSLTTLRLAAHCAEAGVPPGVVNVVTGTGGEVGAALVSHPGVDKINFTGSTEVGRLIAASAGPRMKKFNLELGGKSPVVIARDADLASAIPGAAWAILGNHGQNCCAGSRLYVHSTLFDRVVAGVEGIANSLRIGPGLDPGSSLGPMVSIGHRDKVMGYVEAGVRAGATLLFGGEPVDDAGAYMRPAMLIEPPHTATVVQEEIFGPVQVASRFEDMAEVVERVNGTPFGLGASIFSRDADTIEDFVDAVDAGTIWINNHNVLDLAMPFGGWKQSGVGHELGEEGLLSHLSTKAVIRRRPPPWGTWNDGLNA